MSDFGSTNEREAWTFGKEDVDLHGLSHDVRKGGQLSSVRAMCVISPTDGRGAPGEWIKTSIAQLCYEDDGTSTLNFGDCKTSGSMRPFGCPGGPSG